MSAVDFKYMYHICSWLLKFMSSMLSIPSIISPWLSLKWPGAEGSQGCRHTTVVPAVWSEQVVVSELVVPTPLESEMMSLVSPALLSINSRGVLCLYLFIFNTKRTTSVVIFIVLGNHRAPLKIVDVFLMPFRVSTLQFDTSKCFTFGIRLGEYLKLILGR